MRRVLLHGRRLVTRSVLTDFARFVVLLAGTVAWLTWIGPALIGGR